MREGLLRTFCLCHLHPVSTPLHVPVHFSSYTLLESFLTFSTQIASSYPHIVAARQDLDGCRASSLLLLYALLTPQERASLGTILSHKAKVSKYIAGEHIAQKSSFLFLALSLSLPRTLSLSLFLALSPSLSIYLSLPTSLFFTNALPLFSFLPYSSLQVRSDLSNFLLARTQAVSPSASSADQGALKRATKRLLLSFPPSDKKINLLEKLLSVKDKTVFRLLLNSLSSSDSIGDACAHRDDLRQRLDSKSPLGEYAACLYDAASHKMANEGAVVGMLQYAVSPSSMDSEPDLQAVTSTLLTALAKHVPNAFCNTASMLEVWLRKCSERNHAYSAAVQSAMEKKDKKKGTSATSQGIIAAQTEVSGVGSPFCVVFIILLYRNLAPMCKCVLTSVEHRQDSHPRTLFDLVK